MKLLLAFCFVAQICSSILGQPDPDRLCDYCKARLELGIVLDSSSSISRDNFAQGKKFLQDYLKNFYIDPEGVRVSIITYGRTVHPEDSFNLTTYSTGIDVENAIGNLRHQATGYTSTGQAIKFMREHQLAPRFVREGVSRAGLVITDGNSQETKNTSVEAQLTRNEGIQMFAIGVGHKIDNIELESIAGSKERTDRVDSYDKLITIVQWLVKLTCVGERL